MQRVFEGKDSEIQEFKLKYNSLEELFKQKRCSYWYIRKENCGLGKQLWKGRSGECESKNKGIRGCY